MSWNPSLQEILGAAGIDGKSPAVVTLRIECDGAHSPAVVIQDVAHSAPRKSWRIPGTEGARA